MGLAKKKIATHGIFIGHKEVNYLPTKKKLSQLILDELNSRPKGLERKKILTVVQDTLNQNKVSDVINDKENIGFSISQQEWHWLDRHEQSKWVDYIIYRYQFKVYPAQRKLLDFPLYLLIEPISICNLNCVMCFQSDKTFRRKEFMGFMPWELFTKLVDEAKENNCNAITLSSRGEPVLHKDFGKMLHYITEAGILDLKINTNATRLTEEIMHDILSSGVSEVVFSVDAATKKTYEEIRRGGIFEEVVNNIRKFHEVREKHYPNSSTVTRVSGVKVHDDQNAEQMSNFWSDMVDEVAIKSAIPRWDTYNNKTMDPGKPCSQLWKQMYVWYDGTVNPCDFDYKSYLKAGNANINSLKEIWQSDAFNKLRENHINGNRSRHMPCDRCPLI